MSFNGNAKILFMKNADSLEYTNKIIPRAILKETKIALSYYPELKATPISFQFRKKIKKSYMQAQPEFSGIFKRRSNRSYRILVSEHFVIDNEKLSISEIPSEVLIGWIGHELGHVIDYQHRSGFNLFWFGVKYVTSDNFIKEAERAADTYAVNHGMGDFILATKDFILSQANLSIAYRERIKRLYLSPEEIVAIVEKLKKKTRDKDDPKNQEEEADEVLAKKEKKEQV